MTLDEAMKQHVLKTLVEFKGNKSAAARELDVDRRSLYRMLHRWGIVIESSQEGHERRYRIALRVQRLDSGWCPHSVPFGDGTRKCACHGVSTRSGATNEG